MEDATAIHVIFIVLVKFIFFLLEVNILLYELFVLLDI